MKILIKNGQIVNPLMKENFKGNILIENGTVAKISKDEINDKDADVIDANGKIVSPGFIDAHVHLRDPGLTHKEDIHSGLEAAAAGGFSACMCMPNTKPVIDSVPTLQYILEKAQKGNGVRLYPVAAATSGSNGENMAPIGSLKENGAVAISDDGRPVAQIRAGI